MERRNFQGANRKHNSDLSVCHTAHTHPHTFGHAVEKKKNHSDEKTKVTVKSGKWDSDLSVVERENSPSASACWAAPQSTTSKASMTRTERERENTEREGERWKCGGRSAERTSWFKLRHVDMCALCAQFSVCVSICSRQRGLTKSALLVWHTGWVSVPEKSLKSCFFFNAGALNKVLCCENRSNAPNWTFQRV